MKVWYNGVFMEDSEATISLYTHALHYGSAFFEGIRAYELLNEDNSAIFRVREHYQRLYDSAKIYKTNIPFPMETLIEATKQLMILNNMKAAYIRPIVFRAGPHLGVNPRKNEVHVAILTMDWGRYLGEEAMEKGARCQVSTWRRPAPDTLPALAKAAGNYLNSQLIKLEAIDNGYDEGIALDYLGNISEGSGENIFLVKDGMLYTPPLASSSLSGITRDSIVKLAADLGIPVREQVLPREFLYIVDEVFLTGTAAEITPVSNIDGYLIGSGMRGPLTKQLQESFFRTVQGLNPQHREWLEFLH
ncbi:Branched-chain-amino-acid aminotransferase [bioreactor metagenome]|uniref:branched-chain-amino-acid transaminase n=1 Tax=bioreactor metagenome TaxID=1076179 RepID=A0A644Z3D0_9ZZZZ|nr:branched-chain amino acid transaminase [Erysipelotrichaceae bacterium]